MVERKEVLSALRPAMATDTSPQVRSSQTGSANARVEHSRDLMSVSNVADLAAFVECIRRAQPAPAGGTLGT